LPTVASPVLTTIWVTSAITCLRDETGLILECAGMGMGASRRRRSKLRVDGDENHRIDRKST
jgi:hypothetical protein